VDDSLLLCNSEFIARESWQFKALFEFRMFHSVRRKEYNLPPSVNWAVNYIIHRSLELSYMDEHIFILDKPLVYGVLHDFHIV
jgi:hypothetical protein